MDPFRTSDPKECQTIPVENEGRSIQLTTSALGELDCMPDILTCGVCQKDFPLADIVRFIQHKVQLCNKENNGGLLYEDSDEDSSSPPALVLNGEEECLPKEEPVSSSSIIRMSLTSTKDASAKAAEKHEPRIYVCSTCKQSLSTAWELIQHVQNIHGLRICADPTSDDPPERPSTVASEPLVPYSLRAPLLERQMEPLSLFSRNSSQDLRLDLIGKSGLSNGTTTPPPLLEPPSKVSSHCEDFYSQRLRVLAGATSPNSTTPQKLLPSSFKAMLNNAKTSPRTSPPLDSSPSPSEVVQSTTQNSSSSDQQQPHTPKNRLCEYCGKSFQFKSNLIVHRRSHTGEKPFKCHICNHACTQASKLKRHMKTHCGKRLSNGKFAQRLADLENGSDDGKKNGDEKQQTNGDGEYGSDEEEEEEEEVNVDGIDEADPLRENGDLVIDHTDEDMVAEDLTKKKADESKKLTKYSVISEIMEKNGFGCIPPYNEAYKQALKESSFRVKHDRGSDGSASNDAVSHHSFEILSLHHPERPPREGTRSAGQSPLSFGGGLLDSFDHLNMKRIRLEDKDKDRDRNYLYAGVWFPRVENPQPQFRDLYGVEATQNHKSESSPSTTRPGTSSAPKPKDPSRRNDTCEYCGKVFKNCSNLTVHRRSHTGEKPYKCELCSYACAQSSKLTRHMKTHGRMGKDVYRCRFCDMPFSVASTLEKHMRKCVVSQSGGSPYLVSEPGESSYLVSEPEDNSKEMTA